MSLKHEELTFEVIAVAIAAHRQCGLWAEGSIGKERRSLLGFANPREEGGMPESQIIPWFPGFLIIGRP